MSFLACPTFRGRVAMSIADNLRIHTAQGSRLVCSLLTELSGQVYLIYTPAFDPDANGTFMSLARRTPRGYP